MSYNILDYFSTIFISARLAEILRLQAALLEHIVTEQRYYSDYFRVAFYGNFPVGIRNKQFVVRLVAHLDMQWSHILLF